MPQADISFANKQGTGLQELAGSPGVAMNVVIDQTGAIRRRPGIQAAPGVFTGVVEAAGLSGIYTTIGGQLYAVGMTQNFRQLYSVGSVSAAPIGQPLSDASLDGNSRPVFAETQLLLAIAGGAAMEKIVLNGSVPSRLGGSPPYASHVVANSSRLLGNLAATSANNTFDKDVVRFSDIANGNSSFAGMESWTEGLGTAGHLSAESKPDPVVAIYENTNEIFCFGSTSLQIFAPDPTTVYAPAVTRELGCAAPYSVIKVDQQFAWLDHLRRIVMSDGRSQQVISEPIWKDLDDMSVVSDCFGYRITEGFLDVLVWTFPTDGRTFAFQQGSGWAEWSGWSESTNNWTPFGVTASHLSPATHDVLAAIGGQIGRFEVDATNDLGTRINANVTSGYLARGTDALKWCKCVRVAMRRGQNGTTAPQALLSWRDRPGAFGPPIVIDLGVTGDTEPVLEFRSLGPTYRRRQWKFEFSGSEPLELVSVTEDYDILTT